MALPADFNKIFGSTATGGLTPIGDVNYAKGWEFVGSNPPTKNDFSYLQNLSDLKSQWLYSNKLQRTDPFGDIKADGAAAIAKALANLGLTYYADKNVESEQYFKGPVISGDRLEAKYGGARIILSAQSGQKIVVYTDNTYRGGIQIPLRDGTMALVDDVNNVSAKLLGIGQTWQNVKGSRSAGVTYTNSTGRPIAVSIAGIMGSRQTGVQLSLAVDGVEASSFALTDSNFDIRGNVFAIVPPGANYNLTANKIDSILTWSELR